MILMATDHHHHIFQVHTNHQIIPLQDIILTEFQVNIFYVHEIQIQIIISIQIVLIRFHLNYNFHFNYNFYLVNYLNIVYFTKINKSFV